MTEFNPLDMTIIEIDEATRAEKTSRFEASRFLDSPETISAFLAEAMRERDTEHLMEALGEVAKAIGINKIAQEAGVNRESLYKTFKTGTKPRFDTVMKVLDAFGVEFAIQPKRSTIEHKGSMRMEGKTGSVKIHTQDGRIEEERSYPRKGRHSNQDGLVMRDRDSNGRFVAVTHSEKSTKRESKAS